MAQMTKSLPALPLKQEPANPTPAPLAPSTQPLTQSYAQERKFQALRWENEQLRQQIAVLQGDRDQRDNQIRVLLSKNWHFHEQTEHYRKLVTQLANSVADAFQEFQLGVSVASGRNSLEPMEGEIPISHEDVLSAWSDSA